MNTYKEIIMGSLALIALIVSIIMSYKKGDIDYGWIIGTILIALGSFGKYFTNRNKDIQDRS